MKQIQVEVRPGSWYGSPYFKLEFWGYGERKVVSTGTIDEKEARHQRDEWREQIRKGFDPFDRAAPIFELYGERWLAMKAQRREPSTLESYRQGIHEASKVIGHLPLNRITRQEAREVASELSRGSSRSESRVKALLAGVRGMFAHAVSEYDAVTSNPFTNVGLLVEDLYPRKWTESDDAEAAVPFSEEEERRLLACVRSRDLSDYVVVLFGLRAALRESEIMSLHWTDLDRPGHRGWVRRKWSRGRVGPTKSKTSRRIFRITPDLEAALSELWTFQTRRALELGVDQPEALFPARMSKRGTIPYQSGRNFGARFIRDLEKAGIPRVTRAPFHRCRHTWATRLLSRDGRLIFQVSKALGHSDIRITYATYGHLVQTPDFDQAVDALELPRSAPYLSEGESAK